MWVTILEKPQGGEWSVEEVAALESSGLTCEIFKRKPRRLVVLTRLPEGITFQEILNRLNLLVCNRSGFTVREVKFNLRWEDIPIPTRGEK